MTDNYLSPVDKLWSELKSNHEQFLETRKPLEDIYLECKASVFSDRIFDHMVCNCNFQGPASKKLLHQNLFGAISAIAAMANQQFGGILLIGVSSLPEEPCPIKHLLSIIEKKNPFELTKLANNLKLGVTLGDAQVVGIDDISNSKEGLLSERELDKIYQSKFGPNSVLFGGRGKNNIRDPQVWHCIKFDETTRKGWEAQPVSFEWFSAMWVNLNHTLLEDLKYFTVQNGNDSASFIAMKIRESNVPVHMRLHGYQQFNGNQQCSDVKNVFKNLPILLPKRYAAQTELQAWDDSRFSDYSNKWQTGGRELANQNIGDKLTEPRFELFEYFDPSQRDRINALLQVYVSRSDVQENAQNFVISDSPLLYVTAPPGGGKSAFLAGIISDFSDKPDLEVVYHFIDYTRRDWKKIIASLIAQIATATGEPTSEEKLNSIKNGTVDDSAIEESYHAFLSMANERVKTSGKKLCIVIDALDELMPKGEDPNQDIPMHFIPSRLDYNSTKFIVSSRPGLAEAHLEARINEEPRRLSLPALESEAVKAFAASLGMDLSSEECHKILATTGGTPLYVKSLLQQYGQDPDIDLSTLPETVHRFYQQEIKRILIGDIGLKIRAFFAVLLATKKDLIIRDIARILSIPAQELEEVILPRVEAYVRLSGKGRGTKKVHFLHLAVGESLVQGRLPLISEYDLDDAHIKIISWCDCLESEFSSSEEYRYGFEYLPGHCWKLGEIDEFERFRELISRRGLRTELSCRAFLRKLITSRSQDELLADAEFNEALIDIFIKGNKTCRYTFYRLNTDLNGYGFGKWQEFFWEKIASIVNTGSELYSELFRMIVFTGRKQNKRLKLATKMLEDSDIKKDINIRRRLLNIAGACLCLKDRSGAMYNPVLGADYLLEALSLLEKVSANELLDITHNDEVFAKWMYLTTKATQISDTGYYFNQIGRNQEGGAYYREAKSCYQEAAEIAPEAYLRTRSKRAIASVKSNIGATIFWNNEFREGLELLTESLLERLQLGYSQFALTSLANIIRLLESLQIEPIIPFLTRLSELQHKPGTRANQRKRHYNFFRAWMTVKNVEKAGQALSRLQQLSNTTGKRTLLFTDGWRKLWYETLLEASDEAASTRNQCLTMLQEEENSSSLLPIHSQAFFLFWRAAGLSYLLEGDSKNALKIIDENLQPWFERDNFFFLYLKPEYLTFKSLLHRQIGNDAEAGRCSQEANQLLDTGRKQIRGMHFSHELMKYIDMMVGECGNTELEEMYTDVRNHITTDLSCGL